jgi:hypothetical protein
MEIQDLIKQMTQSKEEIYSVLCSVVEIDQEARTIHAKPLNGSAEIFDVRLQTMLSGVLGLVIWPKINSNVIVSFVSKEVAYIALNSEIEKTELKIGEMTFFVDANNANLAVENVQIDSTNATLNSDNVNVNATNTKFATTSFEVEGETFKVTGTVADIMAAAINLTGIVTIQGATTITGAVAVAGSMALNGGANGGVPKGAALVTEFNKLKEDFADLKAKFNSWAPVNGDGGAALKTKLATWAPRTNALTQNEISNSENTH